MLLGDQALDGPGFGKEDALASRAGGVCPYVPDCLFSVRRTSEAEVGCQIRCHWSRDARFAQKSSRQCVAGKVLVEAQGRLGPLEKRPKKR